MTLQLISRETNRPILQPVYEQRQRADTRLLPLPQTREANENPQSCETDFVNANERPRRIAGQIRFFRNGQTMRSIHLLIGYGTRSMAARPLSKSTGREVCSGAINHL